MTTTFQDRSEPIRAASPRRRPRIVHVIGSLEVGGAERGLCDLVTSLDPALAEMKIMTLIPGGALAESVRRAGIAVESLSMRSGRPDPISVVRLARRLRTDRPDLVVTWMYHANLIGGLAASLAGGIPVVWNIRHTSLHPRRSKQLTRWVAAAGAWLSRTIPQSTVFVAESSRAHHVARGYAAERSHVIPNGFDLAQFRPDASAAADLRHELDVPRSAPLVGLIGRFHPDKDHRGFLAAASLIHRQRPEIRFVLCGEGVTADNKQLATWMTQYDLHGVVHLLGRRGDIPRVAAALDLAVCSSATEACPRAVGEAMACGVPCAVTDVGDAAYLVGETGRVVAAGDATGLGQACLELLALPDDKRRALGRSARRRVAEYFSQEHVSHRHMSLWREVALARGRAAAGEIRQLQAA